MARSLIITDEVKILIAEFHNKHPKWTAPIIQRKVSELCHRRNPTLPIGWPGLSSVQRELAVIRKKAKELPENPQDKPWSTATLDSYPVTPEALPAVLKVWKLRIDSEKWNWSFTIREAKWAARLSALITDIEELSTRASQYARTEILYELIDHPFDSRALDSLIMGRFGEKAKDFTDELM